jgi:hypothetical protein
MAYGYSTKDINPLHIFRLIFLEIMQLLVAKTTILSPVSDSLHLTKDALPMPDVTTQDMYMFLYITVPMGHNQRNTVTDYGPRPEQMLWPFI